LSRTAVSKSSKETPTVMPGQEGNESRPSDLPVGARVDAETGDNQATPTRASFGLAPYDYQIENPRSPYYGMAPQDAAAFTKGHNRFPSNATSGTHPSSKLSPYPGDLGSPDPTNLKHLGDQHSTWRTALVQDFRSGSISLLWPRVHR
jgi:hypothetical protein